MNLKDKCNLWLEAVEKEHITDQTFDELSYILSKRYDKLPKWFRDKVPLDNLEMGSTLGMEIHRGD